MNNKIIFVMFVHLVLLTNLFVTISSKSEKEQVSNPQYISNQRNISVDGNISDWGDIQPSLDNSEYPVNLNREIKSIYLAHDAKHIFIRLDLYYLMSTEGNYFTNITIMNSIETIYFIQTFYSTLSYNRPSSTFITYAKDFNSDIVSGTASWIFESNNSSYAGFEYFNDTIDLVHFELQIPIDIILANNSVENKQIQIKFWYMFEYDKWSSEAGLIFYDLTFDPKRSNTFTTMDENGSNLISTINLNFIEVFPFFFLFMILQTILRRKRAGQR